MSEFNPNHPVVISARDQWHKFCAILMHKSGRENVEITSDDINTFMGLNKSIVIDARNDRLFLRLMDNQEAMKLAREEGGLPV